MVHVHLGEGKSGRGKGGGSSFVLSILMPKKTKRRTSMKF